MAPRFGYLGYVYREPDRLWMLASFVLLLVVAAFLPYRPRKFSGYAAWFLYASLLVPVATVPLYGSSRAPDDVFVFALFCAGIWIGIALITRSRFRIPMPIKEVGSGLMWAVVATISLVTYVYIGSVFGITLNIMSVFDVYDTRLEYRDGVIPTVPLLGYLISNQGNVINPFLMAFGVIKKRWEFAVLGALGQLVLYSTTGFKTVLISIPLCIGLAFLLRYREDVRGTTILLAATLLAWGAIFLDRIAPFGAVDVLVARIFMNAGYVMTMYRDVYGDGPFHLWDYSFLGGFVEAPFLTSPGYHVAISALGRPDVQMNGSFFADGYANLGYVGILVEAVFLLLLLLLVDSASRRVPVALLIPVGLLPVFTLGNVSPFTAALSSGFGLMILLFVFYPRDQTPPFSKTTAALM
jgi:hypothetical protein